jgi:hypothetical protein
MANMMNMQRFEFIRYYDLAFPPVEDAACGEADKNKFISARYIIGFLSIFGVRVHGVCFPV